jgi:hypothetical protein
MVFSAAGVRQTTVSLIRLGVILSVAVLCANYLNGKNYSDYINKTLIKVHAESNLGVDANELSRLMVARDYIPLQKLLDRNYNVFALVITDCRSEQEACPEQKLLFATNPRLYGRQGFRLDRLHEFPYVVLRTPTSTSVLDLLAQGKPARQGEIIGRVYSISTIPTFAEDYRMWVRDPFRDNELWRRYLFTMAGSLLGGIGVWLILELFLKIRRNDLQNAVRREAELMDRAATYLHQLEDNEERIKERERHFNRQFEAYVDRIRELEQRIQDATHYRDIASAIIDELEAERNRQAVSFQEELARTETEKLSLQTELDKYRNAPSKDKTEASRALAHAINPQFANAFEKRIYSILAASPAALKGEWRILPQLDVAGGKATSKIIDFVLISKNCLVVLEVKNYWGKVDTEGDATNTRWHCTDGSRESVGITSSWGINPYHQVREYVMSLMNLVQQRQPQWRLPVYGMVVFPESADISALEEKIGRYYRVIRSDRLVVVLENIDAEARREHAVGKRPTPEQVENELLRRR